MRTTYAEIMLRCTQVNHGYMRLPAGQVGFDHVARLYKRLALQSLECAQAWHDHLDSPPQEPATRAFCCGVVAWADAFGLSLQLEQVEWGTKFVAPHYEFANYLRPGKPPAPLAEVEGSPVEIIMKLDAQWTGLVIKLTVKWGPWHHLRDWRALFEARRLIRDLRRPDSDAYKAYLKSDIEFFKRLFRPFPFSEGMRQLLDNKIKMAEEEL